MNDKSLPAKQANKPSLITKFASKFGVDPSKMMATLKATAFKQKDGVEVTNEQMMALLVVADQYELNPWTKEIYAFPDKQNGIVPVVGVDGWSRIINSHPEFDGMEFKYSDEQVDFLDGQSHQAPAWCDCIMYRKDRKHPTTVREYLDEVYRAPFVKNRGSSNEFVIKGPWQTHTRRFLRHKAMIQCARLAFSFVGIYDQDEAERIIEMGDAEIIEVAEEGPKALPEYPSDKFEEHLAGWTKMVENGNNTVDNILITLKSTYTISEEQEQMVRDINTKDDFLEEYEKNQEDNQ